MRKKLPPLNALRSFEAAARHSSFKEAANELCVSHSAISHQIKLLEQHLGVELFNRRARSVDLTASGNLYYPVLNNAFDNIAEATGLITAPHAAGIVTVQLYSTLAIRWLIPHLPHFQQRHPDIQVRLTTAQSDVDFAHDDVDACIRIGKPPEQNLHSSYLFSSELFPVCSREFLRRHTLSNSPANLSQHTILQVSPSAGDWNIWLQAHQLEHVDPNSGLILDSYDHALATAVQGLGVALGMHPYLESELANGTLVEIFRGKRVPHHDDWYFVCRKGREHNHKIAVFHSWLVDLMRENQESFPQPYSKAQPAPMDES